jgi:hypothetical protein
MKSGCPVFTFGPATPATPPTNREPADPTDKSNRDSLKFFQKRPVPRIGD